jgi:uncharacterized SAM-binding protein YcdF (DUF218 family)
MVSGLSGVSTKERPRLLRFGILCILLLAVAGVFLFREVGRWLVVSDELSPADAIVILNGASPYRAIEAGELCRQGLAPEVWITRSREPFALYESLGVQYKPKDSYSAEIVEHFGAPHASILILEPPIVNTADEMRDISAELRRRHLSRVIIVTSPQHTRRVRALWRRLAAPGLVAMVHPAPCDPFDAPHWWHTTRDSFAVIRELFGLLNAWTGLHILPAE